MPAIRNSELIKRFTDYFKLKTQDSLSSEAGRLLVPVVTLPVPENIRQITELSLNDSDKTLSVPVGKQWKLLYGIITLTTTATAGNRRMNLRFRDPDGNDLYVINALNVQVASTTESYSLGQFSDVVESVAIRHLLPIPNRAILPSEFQVRIFDSAAIAAAADDMLIRLVVEEIEVTGE